MEGPHRQDGRANTGQLCGWLAQREGGSTVEPDGAVAPGSEGKSGYTRTCTAFSSEDERKLTWYWSSKSHEGLAGGLGSPGSHRRCLGIAEIGC